MPETTALGAAMAAGKALGIWSLDRKDLTVVNFERFVPNVSKQGKIFSLVLKEFKVLDNYTRPN